MHSVPRLGQKWTGSGLPERCLSPGMLAKLNLRDLRVSVDKAFLFRFKIKTRLQTKIRGNRNCLDICDTRGDLQGRAIGSSSCRAVAEAPLRHSSRRIFVQFQANLPN